jgi:hypothetical protein
MFRNKNGELRSGLLIGAIAGFLFACIVAGRLAYAAATVESSSPAQPVTIYSWGIGSHWVGPFPIWVAPTEVLAADGGPGNGDGGLLYDGGHYEYDGGRYMDDASLQANSATNPLYASIASGPGSAVGTPMYTSSQVAAIGTTTCQTVIANADGGLQPDTGPSELTPTAAVQQELIVESGYGNVKMINCTPCVDYSTSGMVLNDGLVRYFLPQVCPDGGAPKYALCSQTYAAGHPIVQMCR